MDRLEPDRDAPCADAPADIEDLLDGLLDPAEATALREHIDACAICREDMATEKKLRRLLAADAGVRAPDGFTDDVMACVREPRRRLLVLPALAAAAAVLLLAVLVGRGWSPEVVDEPGPGDRSMADAIPAAPEPEGSPRARDLARRARLFLAVAEQASPGTLTEELRLSGLGEALASVDLTGLPAADRDAVRRVSLLGEAWRNGAPVARDEVAMLVGGAR